MHQTTEKTDTAAFDERLRQARSDLTSLDQHLRTIYSIGKNQHADPLPKDLKGLKDWCSTPLETCGIQSRKHLGYLGSRFLARKILPSPPNFQLDGYFQKLSKQPVVNDGFIKTIDKWIPKLFKKGWDRRYREIVQGYLPSLSSSRESKRKNGGARAWWQAHGGQDHFVAVCLGEVPIDLSPLRDVVVVDDAGKLRVVTVGSAIQHVLGPLHILLYEVLSGKEWLLRGDAKPASFKDFTASSGEIFVSGDYESATDNFNRLHSRYLLWRILDSSSVIPEAVKSMAVNRLNPGLLRDPQTETVHIQWNGQMMGDLLSFPLLCLTNFLAFKHSIKRKVPLRINGDDIVFRCTRAEYEEWSTSISDSGLVLSKGKTLVSNKYFSLNSTFFSTRACQPRLVPVVRAKSIYASIPRRECAPAAITSRVLSAGKGLWPQARSIVKEIILRRHRKMINSLPGSLNQDFKVKVEPSMLQRTGLLERELDYIWLPALCKSWVSKDQPRKGVIPDGWRLMGRGSLNRQGIGYSKAGRKEKAPFGWEEKWGNACIQHAWTHALHEIEDVAPAPPRVPIRGIGGKIMKCIAEKLGTPITSSEWREYNSQSYYRRNAIEKIQVLSKQPMRAGEKGVWWEEEGSVQHVLTVERLKRVRRPVEFVFGCVETSPLT